MHVQKIKGVTVTNVTTKQTNVNQIESSTDKSDDEQSVNYIRSDRELYNKV